MSPSVLRSLVIAIVAAFATLGCAKEHEPTAVAAPQPDTSVDAAVVDEAQDDTCAAGDIECEERLYQLEETLFAYEAGVARQLDETAHACWKVDIDAFRRSMDACESMECNEIALLERIASLHPLQAEEHRAAIQLPEVPLLLAVLAPHGDSHDLATSPTIEIELEVKGGLVHAQAHPEHMGIAVRADENDHVFIFDMDIGSQSGQDEVLGLVGASPTARVLVRGSRLVAPTGIANFDPAKCRWVYEVS